MEEVTSMNQLAGVDEPVGARLRVARERAGMSQEELARHLGVEIDSLRAWESGARTPRANRVVTLAGLLGVSITWLLEGREDEHMASGSVPTLGAVRSQVESLRRQLHDAGEALRAIDEALAALARESAGIGPGS